MSWLHVAWCIQDLGKHIQDLDRGLLPLLGPSGDQRLRPRLQPRDECLGQATPLTYGAWRPDTNRHTYQLFESRVPARIDAAGP
jgi:hypothetical protein